MLLPSAAGAQPLLRVSFPDGLACPDPAAVLASLTTRFGASRIAPGRASGAELSLSLISLPGALELDLMGEPGDPSLRRRLPLATGSCSDVAETIGLLVDAWLRDLPWHGAGFLPDVPAVEPAGMEMAIVSRPAEPLAVTRPFLEPSGLTLRAGGAASLGSDATGFGPEASLSADLEFSHGLGLTLSIALLENSGTEERLSNGLTAGISASRQVFALAPRYAFFRDAGRGPRVLAGLAVEAFEAHASGFSSDGSRAVFNPAGFLGFLWQEQIWTRVSAYAQLSAVLGPPLNLEIATPGASQPVLALPFGWFDLSLGLAVRLF